MPDIPKRSGERPRTNYGLPHQQLDQNPPANIYQMLKDQAFDFEFVERRPSIISVPGAEALWLQDEGGHSCTEAFMVGNEFAHVHPDGSLHASLSPESARAAIEAGWAVFHPWSKKRPGWEGFVMIYTPSSADELDVVFQLVQDSYRFVTGRELN